MRAYLGLYLVLFANLAFAREGFFDDQEALPELVAAAQPAVFRFQFGTLFGSAFLVKKEKLDDGRLKLAFLTLRQEGRCGNSNGCRVDVLQAGRWQIVADDTLDGQVNLLEESGLSLRGMEIESGERHPPLVLLTTITDDTGSMPEPLQMAETCALSPGQATYTIGFPKLWSRLNHMYYENKPPADGDLIYKRFSVGQVVSDRHKEFIDTTARRITTATTNDYVEGMDGAPLLNAEGRVVGLQDSAYNGRTITYHGREDVTALEAHGRYVRCQTVKDYLQRHGMITPASTKVFTQRLLPDGTEVIPSDLGPTGEDVGFSVSTPDTTP